MTTKTRAVTGQMVAKAARKYVGAPILEGGRDVKTGIDCVGLVLGVAHALGLSFPKDVEGYGLGFWRHPKPSESLALLRKYMSQTHDNDTAPFLAVMMSAKVGDVLFFETHNRSLSLAIVTEMKPPFAFGALAEALNLRPANVAGVPISKVIGGLHDIEPCFEEYPFDLKWGWTVSACFRFREVNT